MSLTEEQEKKREERLTQAKRLLCVVPEALEGGDVPAQVLQSFAVMVQALLEDPT